MSTIAVCRNVFGTTSYAFSIKLISMLADMPEAERENYIYEFVSEYVAETTANPYSRESERLHEDIVEALSYQVILHKEVFA